MDLQWHYTDINRQTVKFSSCLPGGSVVIAFFLSVFVSSLCNVGHSSISEIISTLFCFLIDNQHMKMQFYRQCDIKMTSILIIEDPTTVKCWNAIKVVCWNAIKVVFLYLNLFVSVKESDSLYCLVSFISFLTN